MKQEPERHTDHRVNDDSPFAGAFGPEITDEEEQTEAEESLECRIAESIQARHDAEKLHPAGSSEGEGDENQQEGQHLRSEPDCAEGEVDEQRHHESPAPDRADAGMGKGSGNERVQERERQESTRRRVPQCGEWNQQHVEQELLVAEPIVHDAESRPVEGVEHAALGVRPRNGQVVVSIRVVEDRKSFIHEREHRRSQEKHGTDHVPELARRDYWWRGEQSSRPAACDVGLFAGVHRCLGH